MTKQPAYTRVSFDPVADPRAVVAAGAARFTVLTSRLIRMEHAPDGRFEDRASQVFWYRRQPVPAFQVERDGERLLVTTEHLRLEYTGEDAPFGPNSLAITLLPDGPTWRYGDTGTGNLLGTARTLDRASGSTRLEPGLLSRDGWTVVDDSRTLVFDEDGWLKPRDGYGEALDLYFLGYGRAYRDALRDYRALSGGVPLLPRWALGNWWSRYWEYSDADLRALMTEFRANETPLSVCIVDMDWHLVDVGEGVSGWTGYTWNPDLFPDPEQFIAWLHEQGLKTSLNLHPALGIRPHEAMYATMAERLGLDADGGAIPFDIADQRFADAYFEVLHHPQEAIGVDFWWMDWQQGTQTATAGLDPLWWLNHLHFYDLGRAGKRPFIFSRWGGLGNHRYPIGFSGDTVVSWESLAFQPYFTATAANVAYGWWSHDIGGHMQGIEDRELYTRWVQFGLFSPILRLHCTKNPFHERRPWGYDPEVFQITREAMQMRHALIPYLYTLSRRDETDGLAPVRPMYHDYPDHEAAYCCPEQYLFGPDLLVAPYTAPADSDTRLSRQPFWLPPGDWYHFFSGEYYRGDAWHVRYGTLADIPVFARAGGIVPLGPRTGWGGVDNPAELHLHLFAGADGRFTLFEDDGHSTSYKDGAFALTTFEQTQKGDGLRVMITPAGGEWAWLPAERRLFLYVYGLAAPQEVTATSGGASRALPFVYNPETEVVVVGPLDLDNRAEAEVSIRPAPGGELLSRRDRTSEKVMEMLWAFRLDTQTKSWIASLVDKLVERPEQLADFGYDLAPAHVRALLEVTQGAGAHAITDKAEPHLLVLWNNRELAGFRHNFTQLRRDKWHARERYSSSLGTTPRFRALRPEGDHWRLSVDYFGLYNHVIDGGGD